MGTDSSSATAGMGDVRVLKDFTLLRRKTFEEEASVQYTATTSTHPFASPFYSPELSGRMSSGRQVQRQTQSWIAESSSRAMGFWIFKGFSMRSVEQYAL